MDNNPRLIARNRRVSCYNFFLSPDEFLFIKQAQSAHEFFKRTLRPRFISLTHVATHPCLGIFVLNQHVMSKIRNLNNSIN